MQKATRHAGDISRWVLYASWVRRDTIIIVTEDVRKHFHLIHREVIEHMSRYEVSHFHSL